MERFTKDDHIYLSESAISLLNEHGLFTARDLISYDSKKLTKITLLPFKEIMEIKKELLKKYSAFSQNGYECYKDLLEKSAIISSGIQRIDEFFEGGFFTSHIYELYGRAGCGKSLLAYIFIKKLVMETKQNCFVLDAKNDFSAKKFFSLCEENSYVNVMSGLSRIFIKSIGNIFDLLNSFQEILEKLEKDEIRVRFIVLDSLAAVIYHKDYSQNNSLLTHLANIMHFITVKYHIAILVINLMTTWIEGDFNVQSEMKQRVSCGRFWYTVPNSRIKIERQEENMILSVEKSNMLAPKTVFIRYTDIVNE